MNGPGVASQAPSPVHPPSPEESPDLRAAYGDIQARTTQWYHVARRIYMLGFGIFAVLDCALLAVTTATLVGYRPAGPNLYSQPPVLLAFFVLELAFLLGILAAVRYADKQWTAILEGRISRKISLARTIDQSLRLRTGRGLWNELPEEESDESPSDLVKAMFLMRVGQFAAEYCRRGVAGLFIGILLFGGMGVWILTGMMGNSLPMLLGWNPVFLLGSLVVLVSAIWTLVSGLTQFSQMERRFAPLTNADLWIERTFWRRF